MDLLRLVLSRQPLQKLLQLPRLLRSPVFQGVRTELVGRGIPGNDFVRSLSRSGELSSEAEKYCSVQEILYRSIFLLEVGAYVEYVGMAEEEFDLPLALLSGIPWIQAAALAKFITNDERLLKSNPDTIGDIVPPFQAQKINWTSPLRNIVIDIIFPQRLVHGQVDVFIFGYLDIKLPEGRKWNLDNYVYFAGAAARILQGKASWDRVPLLENLFHHLYGVRFESLKRVNTSLIYMLTIVGYLSPLNLLRTVSLDIAYNAALSYGVMELLQWPSYSQYRDLPIRFPVMDRSRAIEILRANKMKGFLSPLHEKQFRIISGELLDITDDPDRDILNRTLFEMAMPCYDNPSIDWSEEGGSLSGSTFYDSPSLIRQGWGIEDEGTWKLFHQDAYRLGSGDPNRAWGKKVPSQGNFVIERDVVSPEGGYIRVGTERELQNVIVDLGRYSPVSVSESIRSAVTENIKTRRELEFRILNILFSP